MKPRMPAIWHSRPPLLLPVTVTSTIWPFAHFVPIADVDGGGRARQFVEPFVRVEAHDDQLDFGTFGRRLVELPQRHDP